MPALTLRQTLDLALQQHQSGQMAEAEANYRIVLAARPEHADALHLLGLILHQTERFDQALGFITKAISIRPNSAEYYNSLAAVYSAMKQADAAIAAARRAVELQPGLAEASCNLGNAYCLAKQHAAAIEPYMRAVSLRPNYAQAFMGLGNALVAEKRVEEAINVYRRAVALQPNLKDAFYNLGNALRLAEKNQAACDCYRQTIARQPDHLPAINNLACTLQQMGDLSAALALLEKAKAEHPTKARVYSNLANVLADADRWEEAIPMYHQALAVQHDYHEARFNLSLALLMLGDFERGWVEYETRWKCEDFPSPLRYTQRPLWRGEPLEGRRILIHAEQGFGDTLQFARYVPMVAGRGGRTIFQVQTKLHRLLQNTPGAVVISHDLKPEEFDVQCPLWSLPLAFGTTLETIPPVGPAVFIDPVQRQQWRSRLAEIRRPGHRMNVGIIWSGSPHFPQNYRRSTRLEKFAPLAEIPGINFISLQKGPAAEQAKRPPAGMRLVDWSEELNDFADTAALMSELDLIITTDTGAAHLAGLIGRPTWILLMFAPDFRWLRKRGDSPWYPSVRLFRQPVGGDWDTPMRRIAGEIQTAQQVGCQTFRSLHPDLTEP
jgi:tetratricopeptide (TPR) repeat protein